MTYSVTVVAPASLLKTIIAHTHRQKSAKDTREIYLVVLTFSETR